MSLNQGVYDNEIPPLFVLKGTFARFQSVEFASGDVATAKSPIPPVRASGAIRKKGTAVVTTFIDCVFWDLMVSASPVKMRIVTVSLNAIGLISKCLC